MPASLSWMPANPKILELEERLNALAASNTR